MKPFTTIICRIVVLILLTSTAQAQDFSVLEYLSQEQTTATARSMGLAGAFGAVGSDFSNAINNPAGVAFFRKKELTLGLSYLEEKNLSTYFDQKNTERSQQGALANIGFDYSRLMTEWKNDSLVVKRKGLVGWSLAIGMNTMANYKGDDQFKALNPNHSIVSSFVEQANRYAATNGLSVFEQQALQTGLITEEQANNQLVYSSDLNAGGLEQRGQILRSGARRDFFLSGGLNYSNKLYLGASIDLPWIKFSEDKMWQEEDRDNRYAAFNALQLDEYRKYDGFGGRLNLGIIYRFTDYFRMGASLRSTTSIDIKQKSTISTTSDFETERNVEEDFSNNYTLELPAVYGLQMVLSHPEYGLLSLEGEYLDLSSAKVNYDTDYGLDFDNAAQQFNEDADDFYHGAFNVKAGLEGRLYRDWRLRAGAAYQTSPYKRSEDELGADYSKMTLGLGLGYRFERLNIVLDAGYNYSRSGAFNTAYIYQNQAIGAVNKEKKNQFQINITKRFNQ